MQCFVPTQTFIFVFVFASLFRYSDALYSKQLIFHRLNHIPLVSLILSGLCPEPGGVPFSHRTTYDGPYSLGSEVIYKCSLGMISEFVLSCKAQNKWAGKQNCTGSVFMILVQMLYPSFELCQTKNTKLLKLSLKSMRPHAVVSNISLTNN